jgi:hypothetical protein
MAEDYISFDLGDLGAALDIVIRGLLDDIADFAKGRFEAHVPQGPTLRTLEAVNRSRVNKFPFGYEVEAGVGEIEPRDAHESPEYPLFAHEGTGLFNKENPHWIVPLHGNVMVFEAYQGGNATGNLVFTRNVEGQEAQPYLDTVESETQAYVQLKKRTVAALINSLL